MKSAILTTYAFNLTYARKLVEDVPADRMCEQPSIDGKAVPNHAAWVIGHLANTCDFAGKLLGLEPAGPHEWAQLFGNRSSPVPDPSRYPDKDALLKALEEGHARVASAFTQVDQARLSARSEAGPAQFFPTVGEMVTFIMTAHEATHLGQLSAWRRAIGLKSVF